MSFHNLFADGQSDAGAGIFLPVVKPLEDDEDALGVFRGNANAVVPYGESPPPCRRQGTGAPEIPLSWRLGMLYWAPYCLREAPSSRYRGRGRRRDFPSFRLFGVSASSANARKKPD